MNDVIWRKWAYQTDPNWKKPKRFSRLRLWIVRLKIWFRKGNGMIDLCVAGCQHYTGEEIRHHKDCPHYPESLSQLFDQCCAEMKVCRQIAECPVGTTLAAWVSVKMAEMGQLQKRLDALLSRPASKKCSKCGTIIKTV